MSNETEGKKGRLAGLNINSFFNLVVIASLAYAGNSITSSLKDNTSKIEGVSQRMAIMETMKAGEKDQRDRMEHKLDTQQDAITALQLDVARIKTAAKP